MHPASASGAPKIRLPKSSDRPISDIFVFITSDSLLTALRLLDMTDQKVVKLTGKPVQIMDEYAYIINKSLLKAGHRYTLTAVNSNSDPRYKYDIVSFTITEKPVTHASDLYGYPLMPQGTVSVEIITIGQNYPYRGTSPNNDRVYYAGTTTTAVSYCKLFEWIDDDTAQFFPIKDLATGPTAWSCNFVVGTTPNRTFHLDMKNAGNETYNRTDTL